MVVRDHFRAWSRCRVDLGAVLRDRQTAEEEQVRVRDLGLGGACVELAVLKAEPGGALGWPGAQGLVMLLEPETEVTLELSAPTLWDPLPLRGKIAWLRRGAGGKGARAGVRFEHHDAGLLFALFKVLGALGAATY